MVVDSWNSNQQRGWGGYVLKEKIKTLKERIKVWNREHFGDTFRKYKKIEEDLNKLEEGTEDRQQLIMRWQLGSNFNRICGKQRNHRNHL